MAATRASGELQIGECDAAVGKITGQLIFLPYNYNYPLLLIRRIT
uniref:Uncharacterized protein n=1 Tax=Arundo donax TaxID=35708 RepID=A0A0A9AJR9_ARUDO